MKPKSGPAKVNQKAGGYNKSASKNGKLQNKPQFKGKQKNQGTISKYTTRRVHCPY